MILEPFIKALTPRDGTSVKSSIISVKILSRPYASTIELPIGWVEWYSVYAARRKISSLETSLTDTTSIRPNVPYVRVPVLSNITFSTLFKASK